MKTVNDEIENGIKRNVNGMTGRRKGDKMGYERRQAMQQTGEGGGRGKYWRTATNDEWAFPKDTHLENEPKHSTINALCRNQRLIMEMRRRTAKHLLSPALSSNPIGGEGDRRYGKSVSARQGVAYLFLIFSTKHHLCRAKGRESGAVGLRRAS